MDNAQIADIKPPIDLPADLTWVWWVIALSVLVTVAWLIKKKFFSQVQVIKEATPVVVLPWEKALEALRVLETKHLPLKGLYKEYFDGVSDIVRVYLEDRFGIHAPQMSTEEFLVSLQQSAALTVAQKNILKDMMLLADMVKFAKHEPSINDSAELYKHAISLIEESRGI